MGATRQYMVFDAGGTHYAISIEYVGYIVTTSERFPRCIPPRMPSYVKRIMRMEQKLLPIVDLIRFEDDEDLKEQEHIYSLILVLDYQGESVGVLIDSISLLSEQEEIKTEVDSVTQRMVLNYDGKNFVLLNVLKLYEEIKNSMRI